MYLTENRAYPISCRLPRLGRIRRHGASCLLPSSLLVPHICPPCWCLFDPRACTAEKARVKSNALPREASGLSASTAREVLDTFTRAALRAQTS
ncbi:hypothetical protein BS78_09G086500 [Paspalum vaginatum]|nr:hypothetical protein BS78_09G086500 [Paspalum vaginatum]